MRSLCTAYGLLVKTNIPGQPSKKDRLPDDGSVAGLTVVEPCAFVLDRTICAKPRIALTAPNTCTFPTLRLLSDRRLGDSGSTDKETREDGRGADSQCRAHKEGVSDSRSEHSYFPLNEGE